MKTAKELEKENDTRLHPAERTLESFVNFEPGLTVGFNPTNHDFKSIRQYNINMMFRGIVKSIDDKTKMVRIRWTTRKFSATVHYTKLKIYYND